MLDLIETEAFNIFLDENFIKQIIIIIIAWILKLKKTTQYSYYTCS